MGRAPLVQALITLSASGKLPRRFVAGADAMAGVCGSPPSLGGRGAHVLLAQLIAVVRPELHADPSFEPNDPA